MAGQGKHLVYLTLFTRL